MIVAVVSRLYLRKPDDERNTVAEARQHEKYLELSKDESISEEFPWVIAEDESRAADRLAQVIRKKLPDYCRKEDWVFDIRFTEADNNGIFEPVYIKEAEEYQELVGCAVLPMG